MANQSVAINAYSSNSPTKDELLVAMAFDDNYLFPGLVTIFSARSNQSKNFRLLVAFHRLSLREESRQQIAQVCAFSDIPVEFIEIELPVFLPTHGHFTSATWLRLFLPQVIQSPFIYLDADTVCCPGWDGLSKYLSSKLHGVSGALESADEGNLLNDAVKASRGNYLNAGVLVFRPDLLPELFIEDVFEASKNYTNHGFEWVDQDVLNFVLGGMVEIVHPSFNVRIFPNTKRGSVREAKILHFVGSLKPWNALYRLRFLFSFGTRRWFREAKKMLRTLQSRGADLHPLRLAFKGLVVNDGLDVTTPSGVRRLILKVVRRAFSRI